MPDFSKLDRCAEMWTYLGFEPWQFEAMRGVSRKITLVKDSLIGPVARYYAWDTLVWSYGSERDIAFVFKEWKPLPDVVTQRFLFIGAGLPLRRAKSFWLGFKGFLEIYTYTPGGKFHPKIKDLLPPINKGLES